MYIDITEDLKYPIRILITPKSFKTYYLLLIFHAKPSTKESLIHLISDKISLLPFSAPLNFSFQFVYYIIHSPIYF